MLPYAHDVHRCNASQNAQHVGIADVASVQDHVTPGKSLKRLRWDHSVCVRDQTDEAALRRILSPLTSVAVGRTSLTDLA